jgi:hypothetical protein
MKSILKSLLCAAFALALVSAPVARAADETHEGKVVSANGDKILLMSNRGDSTHTFMVTAETKITKNGKPAKLSDIQPGDMATVMAATDSSGGKLVAKEITAAMPK